jgi:DNA polymerase-1
VFVQALKDNYDIHTEWMERLVKRYPRWLQGSDTIKDADTAKKYRAIAKNKLVFPAIYGAGTNSIAEYLHIPENVADDIMSDFWSIFTGLKSWQDRLMRGYYETGYVNSPTGRQRRYPLTRNQVINFPVQGVASDIVCESMNTLSEFALKEKAMFLHPRLNIHDDLTFVVPNAKKVISDAIEIITEVMLTPPFDFINVPLSVECALGHNWYEMKTMDKYWSNK